LITIHKVESSIKYQEMRIAHAPELGATGRPKTRRISRTKQQRLKGR
jgi:hypothetical protein